MLPIHIVDNGSQYSFLIGRCLRASLGVWCEIIQPSELHKLVAGKTAGVILSGGPKSVYSNVTTIRNEESRVINDPAIPVLGICYGMQLMATCLGGEVRKGYQGEFGSTQLVWNNESPFIFEETSTMQYFEDKPASTVHYKVYANATVWMSHMDVVTNPGVGSVIVGKSPAGIAAFKNDEKNCWAVQFHPEVKHTVDGVRILSTFVTEKCKLALGTWNDKSRLEKCVETIRDVVKEKDYVILGLSGGVDSMVTATLLSKVLNPSQWKAVYIDFGTMRYQETEQVRQCCLDLKIPLQVLSLEDTCLRRLQGVTDPEQKRKIMGALFVEAFKNARQQCNPTILAQGTIYPDVIESAKGQSDLIKSHHNVGGLPDDLNLKLLEPLRWFFKDEVRMLGRELGLPEQLINRHPFPGPGLTVRIIGEVTAEKIETVRHADRIFMEHIIRAGLYNKISQAYAGMFEGKSVGVVGDQRRHGEIIVLRAVCTDDFMTASIYPFSATWLETVATDIINNCSTVARVVYDITSKPPGTIELE